MSADLARTIYELPTNVVVAAGAGTGKTHRLTGLYVHIVGGLTELGAPIAPDAIVATTFTREAASEMRARIEARLRRLAEAPLAALVREADAATATWSAEIAATCTRRGVEPPPPASWKKALDALPRGTISTFHAWAGDVVRAHPLEAGVPPGFDLLEPDESDALVLDALTSALGRWAIDDSPATQGAARRSDVARALLGGGVDRLEDAVLRAYMRASEEGLAPSELSLLDDESAHREATEQRRALFDAVHAALGASRDLDPSIASELRASMTALAGESEHEDAVRFALALKALQSALSRAPSWASIRALLQSARGSIVEQATRIADAPAVTRLARPLALGARTLLHEVHAAVVAAKSRRRALDFGDVMRKARDLLRANPAVQEDVARSVHALLVDEFQDTNALQRELVYLVRQDPRAIRDRKPGADVDPRTLRPRGLFVVGDRKQSIYAFRGADVAVFQRMALEIAGEDARRMLRIPDEVPCPREVTGRIVALDENRRSVAPILDFVNALADVDMQGHDDLAPVERVVFEPAAEALRPVRAHDSPRPRVVVPTIRLPDDATKSDVSRDLAACLTLGGELRKLLDEPSTHGLTSLRARDVAILIQTYAILPSLELALACHGVEYAVGARRGLYSTQEAIDLEAFLRLVVDAHDRNALLAVLRGPYVALSDTALLALCGDRGIALPDELPLGAAIGPDERARVHRLREALEDVRRHGERLGTSAALRRALDHLGLERVLALLPRGEQRIGDLRRLLAVADGIGGGVVGFARHLSRARAAATSIASARRVDDARGAVFDRDDDVVRILTVHASKGLEFPVVAVMQLEHVGRTGESAAIVVDRAHDGALCIAARVERGGKGEYGAGGRRLVARALAAQRAERQRLTYVALTRARDLLFVVAGPKTQKHPEHTAAYAVNATLQMAKHLDVARPEWTPQAGSPPDATPELVEATAPPAWGAGDLPTTSRGETVVTTALAEHALCPRRFRLLHLVGLAEHPPRVPPIPTLDGAVAGRRQLALFDGSGDAPADATLDAESLETSPVDDDAIDLGAAPPPLDPRAQGVVAHLALERAPLDRAVGEGARAYAESFLRGEGYDPSTEPGRALVERIGRFLGGSYARTLVEPGVDVRREVPFLVPLPCGASLRGTIDLLVVRRRPGGAPRVEIVDYKLRNGDRADLVRYELQLRAYAAAVAVSLPDAEITAGIAFLGGRGSPIWLDDLSGAASLARIDDVARRFLSARATNVWPRIERKGCDAIRCGFRDLCWPRRPSRADADDAFG